MIPDISKLNWSYYDRPKFEDVKGKLLIIEDVDESYFIKIMNYETEIKMCFGGIFFRYAIIDTGEEPLPLDGIYPIIGECGNGNSWFARCDNRNVFSYIVYGATKEEVISMWNQFVRRLK